MLLYFSPGACSLADHIALHESGFKFDLEKVDLKTHALEDGSPLSAVNPKNYVPVLKLDDGETLTENVAILAYIADRAPALIPPGPLGRYRLLEVLAYIATEIHKSFAPLFHGAPEPEKKKAIEAIGKRLDFIAKGFKGPHLFGEKATVADAYLFVMLLWAEKNKLPIPEPLPAFAQRMRSRPTVQAALKHEGLH
jgi:glutathione S-transferase